MNAQERNIEIIERSSLREFASANGQPRMAIKRTDAGDIQGISFGKTFVAFSPKVDTDAYGVCADADNYMVVSVVDHDHEDTVFHRICPNNSRYGVVTGDVLSL